MTHILGGAKTSGECGMSLAGMPSLNLTGRHMDRFMNKAVFFAVLGASAFTASATQIYFNGFETDIAGWETPNRVASGTDGITSASGVYHATTSAGAGDSTRWGGYNFGAGNNVPTAFQNYTTSVDIYLNV